MVVDKFSFLFGEHSSRKIGRYICDTTNVINKLQGDAPVRIGNAPFPLPSRPKHVDVFVRDEGGDKIVTYVGSDGRRRTLGEGKGPEEALGNSIIFNPTSACKNSEP